MRVASAALLMLAMASFGAAQTTFPPPLAAAGETPPYLMVGASRGTLYVRMFHRMYPTEVMGMVLVDGAHEDGLFTLIDGKPVVIGSLSAEVYRASLPRPTIPVSVPGARLQAAHLKLPADLQPIRLWLERRMLDQMGKATAQDITAFWISDHMTLAKLHEIDTTEQRPLGALPLVVLTRGIDSSPSHLKLQADLARLSSNSRHIVVDDSDHEIHLFRPDAVLDAIADVIRRR